MKIPVSLIPPLGKTLDQTLPPPCDPCEASLCEAAPCDASLSEAAPCDASLSEATPCEASPCDATPCDATPCGASPCDATPCDASLCEATPCDASACEASPCEAAPCDASPSEANACDASACDASPCSPCGADPCELRSASEALEVTLAPAPEASSAGGPTPANDAVRRVLELAAAARALADKHTLKKLQTLARAKGLQIKGSKLAVAERLVQAG